VRCINGEKVPGVLSPEMILDQLRCSGLMEAVRVSRAGFPVRILHDDFISRYQLLTATLHTGNMDDKTCVQRMIQLLGAADDDYRVGLTKVFMRRSLHDRLEEDRSSLLVRDAKTIQRVCRGHRARAYVKLLRQLRLDAVFLLQRMVQMCLERSKYTQKLVQARLEEERLRLAALLLQQQTSSKENGTHHTPQISVTAAQTILPVSPDSAVTDQQKRPADHRGRLGAAAMPSHAPSACADEAPGKCSAFASASSSELLKEFESKVCKMLQGVREARLPQQIRLEQVALSSLASSSEDLAQVAAACKVLLEDKLDLTLQTGTPMLMKSASSDIIRIKALEDAIKEKNEEIKQLSDWLVEARVSLEEPTRLRLEIQQNHEMQLASKLRMLDALTRQKDEAKGEVDVKNREISQLTSQIDGLKGLLKQATGSEAGSGAAPSAEAIRNLLKPDSLIIQQVSLSSLSSLFSLSLSSLSLLLSFSSLSLYSLFLSLSLSRSLSLSLCMYVYIHQSVIALGLARVFVFRSR